MTQKLAFADDHFHDYCGVVGVFGHEDAAKLGYLGLYALQHRGQESAGIASLDSGPIFIPREMGYISRAFYGAPPPPPSPLRAGWPMSCSIPRGITLSHPHPLLAS